MAANFFDSGGKVQVQIVLVPLVMMAG